MRKFYALLLFSCLTFSVYLSAQTKKKGPVIQNFGTVYQINNPDFKINTAKEYKAVFDIYNSPEAPDALNRSIETAARFLNMHAQSGVPETQLKVALVVHGKASKDLLDNSAYQKKYGTSNPNQELIEELLQAGGQLILCGQSASYKGIGREELIDDVQLSLSAMTALIQLQDDNYRLIKF